MCPLLFLAVSLPKDDGNYYQFCYTSVNGDIRGGSTPFTFKTSSVDDLFSVEDFENDLLLIQTRTSVLEDSLQKAIKEKTNIQIVSIDACIGSNFQCIKAILSVFINISKTQTVTVCIYI